MQFLMLTWWEKVLARGVVNFLNGLLAKATNGAEKTALQFVIGFLKAIIGGQIAADGPPLGMSVEDAEAFHTPKLAAPQGVPLNWWETVLIEGVVGFLEQWLESANITNPAVLKAVTFAVEFLQALVAGGAEPELFVVPAAEETAKPKPPLVKPAA